VVDALSVSYLFQIWVWPRAEAPKNLNFQIADRSGVYFANLLKVKRVGEISAATGICRYFPASAAFSQLVITFSVGWTSPGWTPTRKRWPSALGLYMNALAVVVTEMARNSNSAWRAPA